MDANGYGYGDGKWKRVDELLNYKNNEHEQIVFRIYNHCSIEIMSINFWLQGERIQLQLMKAILINMPTYFLRQAFVASTFSISPAAPSKLSVNEVKGVL